MRIALLNPNTSKDVTALLLREAQPHAPDARFVAMTAEFGPRYIGSRIAMAVAAHAAVDMMATLLASKQPAPDAAILACFGDPGLAALREMAPFPVVAMAEASVLHAVQVGRRFGIVTGGAAWVPLLEELVDRLGLGPRLAAIRAVERTGLQIAADPAGAQAELVAAARACADAGADVAILGGAALAGIARAAGPQSPVPLIDSLAAAVTMAQALARAAPAVAPQDPPRPTVESVGLSDALADLLRTSPRRR